MEVLVDLLFYTNVADHGLLYFARLLRTQLWRVVVAGGSAEVPIWGVRLELGIYAHTRGSLQRAGMPTTGDSEEEIQTRPCSMAKRVAAVRELTPSLR
jgi:hypothetical protein